MTQASGTAGLPASSVIIPEELRIRYPELIQLILSSESMNDEERQYWVNILPSMTPDQIDNLTTILTNERDQLAAIDKKYQKEIQNIGQENLIAQTNQERQRRRTELQQTEKREEKTEDRIAEQLLQQIEEQS